MKDGSFLTKAMDLPPENGSHDNDVNGEKEFSESSGYIENIEEDAKPKDNVNTTALQWPLRHNSDTSERNSYGWNGFRRRKTPRCTTNGRISRIPSRYLSSDSDSSDGSARKDMAPRLKVKRRRKSSGNKLRINGCNERQDKLTVKLTEIHRDGVICDRNEGERLDYSECQEVFVQTSPISDDTISGIAHEAQTTGFFEVNKSLTEALKSPETLLKVKLGEMLDSKSDSKSGLGLKKTAVCCLKATGGCVDISSENKRRPRIDSSMESTQQSSAKKLCDQETAGMFKRRKSVECSWTTDISSVVCSEEQSKEKTCDSSTEVSFVSSIQNSKQNEVSCASSGYNDCKVPLQKGNNDSSVCKTPAVSTVANGCLSSDIVNGEETTCLSAEKLDYVKEHAVLSEPCPEKKRKSAKRRFVYKNKTKEKKGEDFGFKPAGLNCFRNNCKMKRRYAKKLNQKQIRTTVKANGGSGLKKQGLIRQLKQKSVDKVKKVVKLPKRINNKVNHKKAVVEVKPVKSSLPSQELDRVLGMRKNSGGIYEFLVQWTNGTSCWVSSDQIVTNQHNCILRDYLIQNDQDISVINRIPFQAYCCDSLSLNECKTVVKLKQEKKKTVVKPPPVVARKVLHDKQEVSVENDGDYCYITLRRETCLRKLTCMKIITEFIAALEDASVSDSKMVIVRGLGSKVFVGLTLDSIYKASAQEKGNVIVLKARYLVQTLTNYPKLLVALISKPAEGIGAVFLSLFDMICSELVFFNTTAGLNGIVLPSN